MFRPLPPSEPLKRGRQGISDLILQDERFDLGYVDGFESWAEAVEQDRIRSAMLRRMARSHPEQVKALLRLAAAIDPEITQHPTTPASYRYMREWRRNVISSLWAFLYRDVHSAYLLRGASTFTCIPVNSSVPLGDLLDLDPERWMKNFRNHLNRAIGLLPARPQGRLFARLHGAYDPTTESYPIHVHGVATGDMIAVIDALRELGIYARAEPGDGRDAARVPIRMSREPLSNMPAPLTYAGQSWWPTRPSYLASDGHRSPHGGRRARIPEPAHTEVLQFFDRWRPEQLTPIMGMRVVGNCLVGL